MKPATALTDEEITRELGDLEAKWERFRDSDNEGHGGSPGEWMYERMLELEGELNKRDPAPGDPVLDKSPQLPAGLDRRGQRT